MKVQDLSSQFKLLVPHLKSWPHVRSNASIVHHKDNVYFLVYRLFIPDKKVKVNDVPIPWKAKWSNQLDTTVLCELHRINGSFKLISERIVNSKTDKDKSIVDSRIFNVGNKIGMSFNTWTQYPTGVMKEELKKGCLGSWDCTYVAKSTLNTTTGTIGKMTFPCLNLKEVLPRSNRCHSGQREEKNWTWWTSPSGEELISYFVEPHIVFKKSKSNNTCKVIANTNGGYLKKIKQLYPSLNFLLGTPPIRYNKDEFIAVGHVKYNYKQVTALNERHLSNKVLHFNKACNPKKPGSLIYMMFIYTFESKPPYALKRISNAFIPPSHGKYLLPFPMGIAPLNKGNGFVISYGEADRYIKLLNLTHKEVEKSLKDITTLNPEKYKFIVY